MFNFNLIQVQSKHIGFLAVFAIIASFFAVGCGSEGAMMSAKPDSGDTTNMGGSGGSIIDHIMGGNPGSDAGTDGVPASFDVGNVAVGGTGNQPNLGGSGGFGGQTSDAGITYQPSDIIPLGAYVVGKQWNISQKKLGPETAACVSFFSLSDRTDPIFPGCFAYVYLYGNDVSNKFDVTGPYLFYVERALKRDDVQSMNLSPGAFPYFLSNGVYGVFADDWLSAHQTEAGEWAAKGPSQSTSCFNPK